MLSETLGGGATITLGPKAIAHLLENYWQELRPLGFTAEFSRELLLGYQAKLLEYFDIEMALPPLENTKGDSAEPERVDRGGSRGEL